MGSDPGQGHSPAAGEPRGDGVAAFVQHHGEHGRRHAQTCARDEARQKQGQRKREDAAQQLGPGIGADIA